MFTFSTSTRSSPQHALKVAQLRVDAAVTITISGKAGSGKSIAAEIIARALSNRGLTAAVIEADDSIYRHDPVTTLKKIENRDDRLYLIVVEDSKTAYKPKTEPTPEPAKETPCSDCTGCEEDEGDLPPMIKAILVQAMLNAKRQGM